MNVSQLKEAFTANNVYFAIGGVLSLVIVISSVISYRQQNGDIRQRDEIRRVCKNDTNCADAIRAAHPICWREAGGEVRRYRQCLKRESKDLIVQPVE